MINSDDKGSGLVVCSGFGAVFALLIGLVVFQPTAGIWIANAVQSEFAPAPDQAAFVRLAAAPKRRPIEPGEWVRSSTKEAAN
jgi:hypothetical protein